MSLRRRSSQYSLFPTCPPLPSQIGAQSFASNAASPSYITIDNQIPSRNHCSDPDSEGKAADILESTEPKGREGRRHTTVDKRSSTDLTILRVIQKLKRQSANMSQLIPLKLQASVVTARMPSSTIKTLPPKSTFSSSSTSPVYPPERPVIPSRSSSIRKERPGPVTDLTIFPYTPEEWRKVMEEVKDLYSKGQYKHCSMRCKQILKGIKDPYRVHPLYSIYLSFFAASSLEITASSLHSHSSTKLPLYQEALAFYQKAESYIEYAAFSADPTTTHSTSSRHSYAHPQRPPHTPSHQMMHHSSNSSMSSMNSVRSSVDSIFSARSSSACSVASSFTSPTSTFESQEPSLHRRSSSLSSRSSTESFCPSHAGGQQRPKKKVSFSLSLPQLPILLSENDIPTPAIDASMLIDSFPNPPTSQAPSPTSTPPPPCAEARPNPALARYCRHLSDLATQLTFHITSIHTSIASHSSARAARRSNGPDLTLSLLEDAMGSQLESSAEGEKLDIQERIRRLREQGWSRKRFDGEKYRLLCEKALDEIAESEMF